jgi:hypothetical protein
LQLVVSGAIAPDQSLTNLASLDPPELESNERQTTRRSRHRLLIEPIGGEGVVQFLERLDERCGEVTRLIGRRGELETRRGQTPEMQERVRGTDPSLRAQTERKPIRRYRNLAEHERQRRVLCRYALASSRSS